MSRICRIFTICRILRASVSVSLPVGKDLQILTVLIPFKRDGVSEQRNRRAPLNKVKFRFPSSGKAFPNVFDVLVLHYNEKPVFLFPSSGKAFLNNASPRHRCSRGEGRRGYITIYIVV